MIGYSRRRSAGKETLEVGGGMKFLAIPSDWQSDLNTISLFKFAARADAQIVLKHGGEDTTAPTEQSQAVERALKVVRKPDEFIARPGADRWRLQDDSRLIMAKAWLDFVLKHNPPDPRAATQSPAMP